MKPLWTGKGSSAEAAGWPRRGHEAGALPVPCPPPTDIAGVW